MNSIDALRSETKNRNWDDEQGLDIPDSSWDETEKLLSVFQEKGWKRPFVSPCGDGTVHFSWVRLDGTRGILEVFWPRSEHPGIRMWWTETPRDGQPITIHILSDHEKIAIQNIEDFLDTA